MTALALAAAQVAMLYSGVAQAQAADPVPAAKDEDVSTVVVTAQRQAMRSAAKLKQNAEEIVDGVVAEEAGKLPDKSITEVLQRIVGVTMDRNRSRGDPEHFSVEGSGISVRGLTWGSSTLNGRESFSAGWPGRELSWSDIPAELMSAVIVHKNPPVELIEGGVSGQVDLRTAMPFDYKGDKFAASSYLNYSELAKKSSPAISGLVSKRWENSFGQWGALLNLSANQNNNRNDTVQVDAYFPRTDLNPGVISHAPISASWRTNTSETNRVGIYGALQWKKNNVESSLTYFHSGYKETGTENALYTGVDSPYYSTLTNAVYDSNWVLKSGRYTYPLGRGRNQFPEGGLNFNTNQTYDDRRSQTRDVAWNLKWTINDRWSVQNDLQWVHATAKSNNYNLTLGTFVPSMNIDLTRQVGEITFDDAARAHLSDPKNYFWKVAAPGKNKSDADMYAWKTDVRFKFDDPVLRDLRFGVRLTKRDADRREAGGSRWTDAHLGGVKPTLVPGQLPTSETRTGGDYSNYGYFSLPQFAELMPTTTYAYPNFFNGKIPTPGALVVPTMAAVKDYPGTYAGLVQAVQRQCMLYNLGSANCTTLGNDWKPLAYDNEPSNVSRQFETTKAAYVSTRFGWDELRFPVEGSVGVRVVHTNTQARGYVKFLPRPWDPTPSPFEPVFGPENIDAPIKDGESYTDVLPSMNLKMEFSPLVQARFAYAKAIHRPSFQDLNEYIELERRLINDSAGNLQYIDFRGRNRGNVHLLPTKADSFDLSLEWYPGNGSSLTGAMFHKKVRDIVLNSAYTRSYKDVAGNEQTFLVEAPQNEADGSVTGLELAGSTYLNNVPALAPLLPGWAKGLGISANYTYIDSKQKLKRPFELKYCPGGESFNNGTLSLFGCDTDGLPFNDMPLQYLSKNAYNLTVFYDIGRLQTRLAYSWRGRFLQGTGRNGTRGGQGTSADPSRIETRRLEDANGQAILDASGAEIMAPIQKRDVDWGLPTWQEASGQLDFSMDWRATDRLSASFSISNLTDVVVKQTQEQHIGVMPRSWFEPGRFFRLALRYSY